jgi:murein DD-endopeptidase MepM/ murein hydrolase activator NlpD
MDNKTTTILVISYDDNNVKSINVNSHFIKYYKRYIAAFISFFVLFLTGLFALVFYFNGIKIDNNNLSGEISRIQNDVEIIDSLKLVEKLNKINYNLSLIEYYLQSRGFNNGDVVPAGNEKDKMSMFSKVINYSEQSDVFLKSVYYVPLGLPHEGNISSEYGYRKNPFGGYKGEFHPGIDVKGDLGDNVYATADGIVLRSDWYNGYGNAVVIDHGFGLTTLYGHLTRVNIVPGQQVKAGDIIGFLGSTGRSTGPHVHYEIRKNGDDINPNPFVSLNY